MFRTANIDSLTDFQRKDKLHLAHLKKSEQPEVLTINGQAQVLIQNASAYQKLGDKLDKIEQYLMPLGKL